MSGLSYQQVTFFRTMGFFKLPAAVTPKELEEIRDHLTDQFAREERPLRRDVLGRVARLDALIQRFSGRESLLFGSTLTEALVTLLGPNIVATLNRHNHSTMNYPGHSEFRLHRDILQWSRGLVTAIIYLENATVENGCTRMVPGSHFLPFVGIPNNGGTWMDEYPIYSEFAQQAVPIPASAGDILLFDSLVFHAAGRNDSQESRMSVTLGFRSIDELEAHADLSKCYIVRGKQLYKGNDQFKG